MRNVYFELTREFNRDGVIAVLGSGQAVVHYRIAMMSKDGDWILRESLEACARILEVLGRRTASASRGTTEPRGATFAPSTSVEWEAYRSGKLIPPWCRWPRICFLPRSARSHVERP
jgi:hypothetical protein